jgi:hypothetical protein
MTSEKPAEEQDPAKHHYLAFNHVWHQTGDFEAKIQTNCM